MSELHDEEIAIKDPVPSVGDQLKLAREAKKMTIGEIAAQLRLTPETISNIEAEHWDKLHGRAYARGYFLSYVKFLGLPEHEMLTEFNHSYTTTETTTTTPRMFEQKRSQFPWMQIILVIAVATATWFAYQQWQRSQSDIDTSDVVSQLSQFLESTNNTDFASSVVEPLSSEEVSEQLKQQDQPLELQ